MRKTLTLLLALTLSAVLPAQTLQLQKGDNIAYVGSGLADRQQHYGNLEALIHQAHADKELVIRNLGFSGDEVHTRHRSDEVPTLEYFLDMKPGDLTTKSGNTTVTYHAGAHFHANVLLAYWGFNESSAARRVSRTSRRTWTASSRSTSRPTTARASPASSCSPRSRTRT
ncbi:hypothetical protein EMGBS10_05030 [Opitutia bacterium]|nr:hypothetical protein EMGBS10_05030 [Opitutae bacterium]